MRVLASTIDDQPLRGRSLRDEAGAPFVVLQGVVRRFGRAAALDGVDLTVGTGETLLLVGPSGSGKSTLLNLVAGLDRPDGGRVVVAGADLGRLGEGARARWRARHLSFVFQSHLMPPRLAAWEVVAMPLLWTAGLGLGRAKAYALAALERVGLAADARRPVGQFSGGQRQRVAVARALARSAPLLLADEPTSQLDPETARLVVDALIEHRAATGATMIVVSHEQAAEQWQAARRVVLSNGRLAPT